MRNGQNCSPLKTLFNFILMILLAGFPAFSQSPERFDRADFQIESPLKPCWTYLEENIEGSKFASDNEALFLPLTDGKLISVNFRSGLSDWETDLGGQIKTPLYLFGDSLYLVSKIIFNDTKTGENTIANKYVENYIVRRLNKNTGVAIWQTKIFINDSKNKTDTNTEISLHLFEDKLLITASDGNLYLLDSLEGKVIKKKSFQTALATIPFFDDQQVVFGTSDGRIISLLIKDLNEISEVKIPLIPTAVFTFGNKLFWGDVKGEITASESRLNSSGKSRNLWKYRTGGEVLTITPTKTRTVATNLLISSLDNYIYSVSARSGKVIWKKRLSNRPAFTPLVVDNHAVFTTIGDSTALIVEINTGQTVNKISLADNTVFTGSARILGPFIVFPTATGFFSFTADPSEKICRRENYNKQ